MDKKDLKRSKKYVLVQGTERFTAGSLGSVANSGRGDRI